MTGRIDLHWWAEGPCNTLQDIPRYPVAEATTEPSQPWNPPSCSRRKGRAGWKDQLRIVVERHHHAFRRSAHRCMCALMIDFEDAAIRLRHPGRRMARLDGAFFDLPAKPWARPKSGPPCALGNIA